MIKKSYLSLFIASFLWLGLCSHSHGAGALPSSSEAGLRERLKAIGYDGKIRLYVRIFKEEKTLEVWIKSKGIYKLYKSFEVCNYSGKLGPKVAEGDKQAPEGFYHVPAEDVLWSSRKWPRALNLAFPNVYDALKKRTGSYLLIHGGCSSEGCYALKNGPMSILYDLVSIALKSGQTILPIHIFPFRLTDKNWARHSPLKAGKKWGSFWRGMQPAYDGFQNNRTIPSIYVCQTGYQVYSSHRFQDDGIMVKQSCVQPLPLSSSQLPESASLSWLGTLKKKYQAHIQHASSKRRDASPSIIVKCNLKRPSCKRWLALRKGMLKRGTLPKSLLR